MRKDFIDKYIASDGKCTIKDQTSVSIVIMNGLYTDKDAVCAQLADLVEKVGPVLKTGMVGVQYIYDALSCANRPDMAFNMITQSSPGYKNWYENGATTLWELWNGKEKYSHNHHMFSAVIGWFFKSLLGIRVDINNPGFESIEFAPCFLKEVGIAKGNVETKMGKIEIEWKYENNGYAYSVTIPNGINAMFRGEKLSVGKNTFFIKE